MINSMINITKQQKMTKITVLNMKFNKMLSNFYYIIFFFNNNLIKIFRFVKFFTKNGILHVFDILSQEPFSIP